MVAVSNFKLPALLAVVILIMGSMSLWGQEFAGGIGTEANPWQIATAEHLDNVRNYLGSFNNDKHFVLTENINLNAAPYNEGAGWTPIGRFNPDNDDYIAFYGHFDGDGYTISGITINAPNTNYAGLFGATNGATIANVGITNANIVGDNYVGALVGYHNILSSILNCYASGSVRGYRNIGGLVGYSRSNSLISDSYSLCTVTGDDYVGGLLGTNWSSAVVNSYSRGNVFGSGRRYTGGFCGYSRTGLIEHSYSTGRVFNEAGNDPTHKGFVGSAENTQYTANFFNSETSGQNSGLGATAKTTIEMRQVNAYVNWDFDNIWQINAGVNDGFPTLRFNQSFSQPAAAVAPAGNGTEADPYQIAGLDNLYWLSQNPGQWSRHFIQTANIDASATVSWNGLRGWEPIGNATTKFRGSYDGDGHTITGLTIKNVNYHFGLFGFTESASISNLGMLNVNILGYAYIGSIVGYSDEESSLLNCYASGSVRGYRNIGGLVGYSRNNSLISDSYSLCTVTGDDYVGGLVGYSDEESTLLNCYASGSVRGYEYIGGLVGYSGNNSLISDSYSLCTVTGDDYVGGLVGYNRNSIVVKSYSRGNVFGRGGRNTGGFCGYNQFGFIEHSYSTGRVFNEAGNDPTNKGFVGSAENTHYTANFFNSETSGQDSGLGATAKTTIEMRQVNTYVNWDFDDIWQISAGVNDGFPTLRFNLSFSQPVAAVAPAGNGTEADPYLIADLGNLYWLSQNPGQWSHHFIQTANIDASATVSCNGLRGWEPIGNVTTKFRGSYDGDGHTITGLRIININNYSGLFGYTEGASISNLGMINVNILGNRYIGSIVGFSYEETSLLNCYASGSLKGDRYIGGLVGYNGYNSLIADSYSLCTVTGDDYVGGLLGHNFKSIVVNSYSRGIVFGRGGRHTGGFCGYNQFGFIDYSYSTGRVFNEAGNDPTNNGFVGSDHLPQYTANFFNSETSGQNSGIGATAKTTIDMRQVNTYVNWDFDNIWQINAGVNDGFPTLRFNLSFGQPVAEVAPAGNGTEADPYQIAGLDNLYWLSQNPGQWSRHFVQTANIDASATVSWNGLRGWEPIGNATTKFSGSYDGDGHTITGLTIRFINYYSGLFGFTAGASISNLGMIDVNILGNKYIGSVAGYSDEASSLLNCYATGIVRGYEYIGGGVGYSDNNSLISDSYSLCTVTGYRYVGGLVGTNRISRVANSYSRGNVFGRGSRNTGGFCGYNLYGFIEYSYSTGRVFNEAGDDPTNKGFVGFGQNDQYTANFFNSETSGQNSGIGATAKTTIEMRQVNSYVNWDFDNIWQINAGVNDGFPTLRFNQSFSQPVAAVAPAGNGTEADPYRIAGLDNLYWLSQNPGQWSLQFHFIQTANIDASATVSWNGLRGWEPIGNATTKFRGSYDGDGYTITGLTIKNVNYHFGLFGFTEGASISNLGLINVNILGLRYIGSIVGYSDEESSLLNCYASGSVRGELFIGGLVGHSRNNSLIADSYSLCTVTGDNFVGGLVGHNWSSRVVNSYSRGNVFGRGGIYTGGFCGYNLYGFIEYSYSTGRVFNVEGDDPTDKGFVGSSMGAQHRANFFNSETSGQNFSVGATAKTTIEMNTLATFTQAEWDFEDVWVHDAYRAMNEGYPYLNWQTSTNPYVAVSPTPENNAANVDIDLQDVRWRYIENTNFANPVGFRVYFNETGEFGEDDDFEWVAYIQNETNYSCSDILPEELFSNRNYFWKVVPTLNDPNGGRNDNRRRISSQRTTVSLHRNGDAVYSPVWSFRTGRISNPQIAIDPQPADDSVGVAINLETLRWRYVENPNYVNPLGFRVYFNETGEFGEDDDFVWVPFVDEEVEYSCPDILPEHREYKTTYYWKVVPTTREDGVGEGNDAEDVPVWSFTTEKSPYPQIAVNPKPANDSVDVSVELEKLRWTYIKDEAHTNPVGFRVYFSETGDFENDEDYVWINFDEEHQDYYSTESISGTLDYNTSYYWKVVPTTTDPNDRSHSRNRHNSQLTTRHSQLTIRGDAENVHVWTFRTEEDTSVETVEPKLITKLNGNYPNPFNPETTMKFSIKEDTEAMLHIFNIKGQLVKILHSGIIKAGEHRLTWNGKDDSGSPAGSGVYFYRLTTDHYDQVNKMLLVK